MKQKQGEFFTSKWGLIISVLGIAIGTGNIWRFPRIAAQNGSEVGAGSFLIAWIIFLFIWSIPLIIAEYAIGKHGRKGIIGSFIKLGGDKSAIMGGFVGFVATAIMFYYSVVTGWCLWYFGQMLFQPLPVDFESAMSIWNGYQSSLFPVITHSIAMLAGALVVIRGVKSIEKVNKILIPVLFVILLISAGRAISLPGSSIGLTYLFTPDWELLLEPGLWLEALTQNAWDTGAGWGLILTYAVYMKRQQGITISAFQTGIGNNMISLLAAVIIFSTVFGTLSVSMSNSEILEVMKSSGPASTGLTFIWIPQLFLKIPAGKIFAILFFLALSFAAFSSLISMIEMSSRLFVDMGLSRKKAVVGVAIAGFLFGIPSAVNLNFFANQDFVWGVGLMISGAFIAALIIKHDVFTFRNMKINIDESPDKLGRWWDWIIQFIIPIEAAVLLGWWIYRSAVEFAPESWYNPFDLYSVATCFVQWFLVILGLYIMNKKIVQLTTRN